MLNAHSFIKRQKRSYLFRGLLYLFPILLVVVLMGFYVRGISQPYAKQNVAEIKHTWQLYNKENPNLVFLSEHIQQLPNTLPNETIVMERTLQRKVANAELLVKGNHQHLKVFLDGELLYDGGQTIKDKNPGLTVAMVDLPSDYIGRLLQIEVTTPYQAYAGLPAQVFIGDNTSLIASMFSHAIPNLIILTICLALGATLLGFFLYKGIRNRAFEMEYLLLGIFTILVGLSDISTDTASYLFFDPHIHSTLANGLYLLTPIFIMVFLYLKSHHYRKWYGAFVLTMVLVVITLFGLDFLNIWKFPDAMLLVNSLYVVGALSTAMLAVGEWYHRNRFYSFLVPFIMLAAIINFTVYIQLIVGHRQVDSALTSLVFLGLVLVICGYSIFKHLRETDQARQTVQFLEVKHSLLQETHQTVYQHMDELQQLKQEFSGHLQAVQQLNSQGEQLKIDQYLVDVSQQFKPLQQIERYSDQPLVNMIFSRYHDRAKKRHIQTDFYADLPAKLSLSDVDLSSLLLNILDNALAATAKLNDPSQRFVSMHIVKKEQQLTITARNAYRHSDEEEAPSFIDGGYGLAIIEKICQRFDGSLTIDATDDFVLTATLQLP
ncbi:hypothetical protein RU97_GL001827 [Enterococcus canis]|uniref:Sensor histidine kinase NatK-like C-terminal domain-containing protein n=1 Tax=Enterococcus canis TaxID=214095 RepID=A0A1L8RF74_9ENTE|nr:GHKL domain-containing protein [Enterococcus canis]OJG18430.1 hypothetical protein RU97_GL001827 [Enterococcus canis]